MTQAAPSSCLAAAADVRALREALPDITYTFDGFPLASKHTERANLRGCLLYLAILCNPAEVFRVARWFEHIAAQDPQQGVRSEKFRSDVALLLLRWQALPPFHYCFNYRHCGLRAGYVIARGVPTEAGDWRNLHFSDRPRLCCDRRACQKKAASHEYAREAGWTALPLTVDVLMEYVDQEFVRQTDASGRASEDRLFPWLEADPANRRAFYAMQERFGDQLVRLHEPAQPHAPHFAPTNDFLHRARRFFKILPPYRTSHA